jgi:hypothetical protein
MPEKSDRPLTGLEVPNIPGPHYTAFYTNNISYAISAVDLVLIFGEIVNTGKSVHIEQRARVTMTLVQAKILRDMLTQNIARFEEKFGKVTIPEEMSTLLAVDDNEG